MKDERMGLGAGLHRRGVGGADGAEMRGGAGEMTQRQRMNRAREYSRACRIRRLRNALWVVAAVLAALLAAELIWLFSSMPASGSDTPEAALPQETAILLKPEVTESTGVFTVTGYCACCTPYADVNRDEAGRVLTASGEWTEEGACVAVDPEIIPLGSTVTVGEKTYKALDTGVRGYVVDVLMAHEDAAVAGARRELVTWKTDLKQGETPS